MSLRITRQESRLATSGDPQRQVSQASAGVMGQSNPRRRISLTYADAMIKVQAVNALRIGQSYAQVLIDFTPNFEWIEMFIPEVFPYDISFNSIGATRFQTDVVMVDSGHDQRQSRWSQPLMEYDVAYGVRTMEHLHGLIAFFRAMGGRANAFLYKDVMDHTSTLATGYEARRAPDISPLDQAIATGDAVTKTFQLVKRYPTPGLQAVSVRPIYKPKGGTVSVAINGTVVSNYTLDLVTGKITFTSSLTKAGLNNMAIAQAVSGGSPVPNRWRITGVANTFTGFSVNDKIVVSGLVNSNNNSTEDDTLKIVTIATDKSWIEFSSATTYGAVESSVNGVTVRMHPAPRPGELVTAGFEFYVPVRFDTDRLPVSLEEYGVGGAADVKLIEVRPHQE
jgi:uncharacterized protein (TIGR02217 family)